MTALEDKLRAAAEAMIETANQFQTRLRGVEEGVRLELVTIGAQLASINRAVSAEREIETGRDERLWKEFDKLDGKLDAISRQLAVLTGKEPR